MSTQLETVQSPELWCPFPSRISPYAEQVYHGTSEWLEQFGLGGLSEEERGSIAEVAHLAARFHPDASPEILQLVSDWYAWFFYQDDHFDAPELRSSPEKLALLHQQWLSILNNSHVTFHSNPFAHALRNLYQRWSEIAPSQWMHCFVQKVSEYFWATVWEATNRRNNVTPSMLTYMYLRPVTGGMGVEQLITDLVEQIELPLNMYAHPLVRTLTFLSDHVVCWMNDIVSLDKELSRGDVHNLVLVLKREHHVSQEEAKARAIVLHNNAVQDFLELADQIPVEEKRIDAQLQRYVQALHIRMGGHVDWAARAHRYRVLRSLSPSSER